MDELARQWLTLDPPLGVYGFLEATFDDLVRQYGAVYGHKVTAPKIYAVAE